MSSLNSETAATIANSTIRSTNPSPSSDRPSGNMASLIRRYMSWAYHRMTFRSWSLSIPYRTTFAWVSSFIVLLSLPSQAKLDDLYAIVLDMAGAVDSMEQMVRDTEMKWMKFCAYIEDECKNTLPYPAFLASIVGSYLAFARTSTAATLLFQISLGCALFSFFHIGVLFFSFKAMSPFNRGRLFIKHVQTKKDFPTAFDPWIILASPWLWLTCSLIFVFFGVFLLIWVDDSPTTTQCTQTLSAILLSAVLLIGLGSVITILIKWRRYLSASD